jgi:hypothetical protein
MISPLHMPWPENPTRVECLNGYAITSNVPGIVACFRLDGSRIAELTLRQATQAIGEPRPKAALASYLANRYGV